MILVTGGRRLTVRPVMEEGKASYIAKNITFLKQTVYFRYRYSEMDTKAMVLHGKAFKEINSKLGVGSTETEED
jgi:hypothetical protein